jgi:uncharacterized protein (TIGR02284 family)
MRPFLFAALSGAFLAAGCGDPADDRPVTPPSAESTRSQPGGDAKYDQKTDRAEELNELLRGELSAVDTYDQAIDRFGSEPGADELKRMRQDHQDAVATLRDLVGQAGGSPATSAGAWGGFAKAIEGGAKLFGNDAAFTALKQGEEHGIKEYEDALKDEDLTASDKATIKDRLLPKVREHVSALDRLRQRT